MFRSPAVAGKYDNKIQGRVAGFYSQLLDAKPYVGYRECFAYGRVW